MKTADKVLLTTAGVTVASAAAAGFTVKSIWGAITKHKVVGLSLLAIVSYHTFDSYRASVDNAWSKVETVVERRADAAAQEKAAEKTAAFNAQKAADAKKANDEYEAAEAAKVAAILAPYEIPASMTNEECRADAKFMQYFVAHRNQGVPIAEVKQAYKASIQKTPFDKPAQTMRFIMALIDMAYEAPYPASVIVPATYQSCMEDTKRHKIFTAPVKPIAKPKPVPPTEVVVAKPAPTPEPVESNEVREARAELKKAKAICMEVYRYEQIFCGAAGYNNTAKQNLHAAERQLANALIKN